ncbi:hypothetical protein BDY21DRAFT_366323 [Lineolata rhizophorae]|uniref:Uncharacterized protein n=1 Tax=Lineolata rhizophorae TaxID=578093 RepID=A0A6A6NSH6_9PEZI|nr:hypothetical protein BDY21DRAFT_366323 [Lineolata rhizophorae]
MANYLVSQASDLKIANERRERQHRKTSHANADCNSSGVGDDCYKKIRTLAERILQKFLPEPLANPSPGLLVLALLVFYFCITAFYNMNRDNPLQIAVLSCTFVSITVSTLSAIVDIQTHLQVYFPLAVTSGLLLSSVLCGCTARFHVYAEGNKLSTSASLEALNCIQTPVWRKAAPFSQSTGRESKPALSVTWDSARVVQANSALPAPGSVRAGIKMSQIGWCLAGSTIYMRM